MKLPDNVYDILKWLSLIALEAVGLFYNAMSGIWGWPCGEQVWQTCSELSLLIGTLIGISTAQYNKDGHNLH